jgi:hypothetical protein
MSSMVSCRRRKHELEPTFFYSCVYLLHRRASVAIAIESVASIDYTLSPVERLISANLALGTNLTSRAPQWA